MGDPVMDARGLGNRGTANRRAVPQLQPPVDYPPFSVSVLGLIGERAIPDALAWALKWHLDLMRASDPVEAKELIDNLIAVWEWLKEMEVTSPRAPDGALLVRDPLAVWANAKVETKFIETSTGDGILVETSRVEAPLPVWQPTLFPPELPPAVEADYPKRPTSVDDIPPFFKSVIERWMVASVRIEEAEAEPQQSVPAPASGETGVLVESFEVLEPATELDQNEDEAEKAMQAAARALDLKRWNAASLAAFKGVTPTVNAAVATLRATTLGDLKRHTGAKLDSTWGDQPLIKNTEYILYHSVCSFVLDKHGEPFDLRYTPDGQGMFDYPILIEGPGESMRRSTPADDGVYVSVQKYGDSKFRINQHGITKLLFGTVGGFTKYGYGDGGPHWIHERLQSYLDRGGAYGYVAAISVPGLYERREITWSLIKSRIPEFVDTVVPYLVKEVIARASRKLDNWEEFAKEALVSVIQELILDKVRDKIRDYLIKKVGKRIVPGLNAVAALVDLFSGGTERMRMRNIIACMIVALRSRHDEDLHIAAKTCSKVVADEFEDAVMDTLIAKSKKGVAKLKRKNKAQREADEQAERDQARAKQKDEPPPPPPTKADAPKPPPEPPAPPTPPRTPAAQRIKQSDVAQPTDIKKHGKPRSVDVPTSNDGKNVTTASLKDRDTSPPKAAKDGPEITRIRKPATKEELGWLERGRKKQEAHEAKIAKKRKELEDAEQKKKEEEQRLAANGGTATGNDATDTKGTSNQSKGTEDKGTGDSGDGKPPAKPPFRKPPGGAPDPSKKPKKQPEPDPNYIHVKEPDPLPDTDHVQKERADRTSAHSDEKVGRAQFEKQAGQMGVGEHAHHGMQKKGAGEAGEEARDAARTAGVSVNDAANMVPARGLSNDSRAVHGSSGAHSRMHGPYDAETMRRTAETRKDDPEGLRSAQAGFNKAHYEGQRPPRDEFYLGGDPPEKPKRERKPKEPTKPEEPKAPEPTDPKPEE